MTLLDKQPWPLDTPPAQEFCDEENRLRLLASFGLGALEGDPELDRIARFAAHLCEAPSAAISLVEEKRQLFLAREGIDLSETPRSTSFCAHTMLGSDILEVLDATHDERFASFALVTGEQHLRYYVGVPLISSEGVPIGALCVNDTAPRTSGLTELQSEGLLTLAEAVKRRIETHRSSTLATAELKASADRLQFMLDSVPDIAWSAAPGPEFDYFNARFTEVTGLPPRRNVDDWREVIHPEDFDASLEKFSQAMSTATFFEDEWRLRLADGSYRWVISRAVPSSDNPETARWFGTLTDIDERYRISEERKLLAGELAHRIKNVFSVVVSLIHLTARNDEVVKAYASELTDTIKALSRAQEAAVRIDTTSGGNLLDLLELLTAPYGPREGSSVKVSGDRVSFGPRSATPIALVFHELATNSTKYGALSVAGGRVEIVITLKADTALLVWEEKGGPPASPPERLGFGSRLMVLTIENQLGGSLRQDWHDAGLRAEIAIPLERLAQ
ncbi:MAG: PAS domain-containing protein [Erythrobacter sp.]|nr:PAS domain-containing protein [Erythrobacter sp.]